MTRILVTAAIAARHGEAILAAAGPGARLVALPPDGDTPPGEHPGTVDIAFLSTDLMGSNNKTRPSTRLATFTEWLDTGTALRWVHTCSAGSDRPVLQRLMGRGVTVTTSSGANAMAVAHSAAAGLLALARDVPHWIESQQARRWATLRDGRMPRDIDGAHAAVVGTGPIGQALAGICRSLGLRVTGLRRHAAPLPGFDAVRPLSDLPALAPDIDWLLLCCPLTAETRGLVNADLLQRLPAHAGLVNVARGEVVDEAALFAALHAGHLCGVYSDVFVEEPLPADSPWWSAPRTLLSAHGAGASQGFPARTVAMFIANLRRFSAGEPLAHPAAPSPGS